MKLTVFESDGHNPAENLGFENDLFKSGNLPEPESDNFLIRFWSNSRS